MISYMTKTDNSKCFITGCARNCAQYIPSVFENIQKISTLFSEVHVIIAFDYSTDNTLELLHQQKQNFPYMDILTHNQPLSPIRTERICSARNKLLAKMRTLYRPGWDYFIMIDLDDVCSAPINIENIRRYLARNDWDALSWNRDVYYDIWALSYSPYVVSCWNWGNQETCENVVEFMREDIKSRLNNLEEDQLLPCFSAFNGIAIYRLMKFMNCDYDWKTTPFDKLPRGDLIASIQTFNLYPHYRPCFDDCEHRSFHAQATEKNRAKIMISPHMVFN
jgi:glycosyltransferase involved in cell wall biosynthesis